jgi:predicted transposase/invertase (TIGR01784 family)
VTSELKHPHDHFFKESFSRPEVARSFLENYLPRPVLEVLDLSTLTLQKDSFIDPDLLEHFSDLLYRAATNDGRDLFVYLLLEHKSTAHPWTAVQLLGYILRIMEQAIRQGVRHLPVVVPLVVYHGERQWRAATDFADLFSGSEALRPYWPAFRYELFDLTQYSDEEIRGEVLMQVALLTLKHIADRKLSERLPEIFALLQELANKETGLEYLATLLRYLSAAATHVSSQELVQVVEAALRGQGDDIMPTIAEQWIEQGSQQTARENILDLLNIRFGIAPPDIAEQLAEITDRTILRTLHRLAATADTVAAFERFLASIPEEDE